MKRSLFTSAIAVILVMLLMIPSSAATVVIAETGKTVVNYGDWLLEKINEDTQWELDSYKGNDTEIITPRIIDNMLVVSFGSHCFANNSEIKSVVTSSPLWTIGDYAFIDCKGLESFEFNYALHTIGVGAFSGTTALKNINLEDSVVKTISAYAFSDSGLEEITLPDTCEIIDNYAFLRCGSLKNITIPAGVTEIADNAFEDCTNLTVYCYADSYAHQYAERKGIDYVLLDAPVEYTFILGDADGDGVISVLDATLIQRVLAVLVQDVDGMIKLRGSCDGEKLNVTHATKLQKYLALIPVAEPIGTQVTRVINNEVSS